MVVTSLLAKAYTFNTATTATATVELVLLRPLLPMIIVVTMFQKKKKKKKNFLSTFVFESLSLKAVDNNKLQLIWQRTRSKFF